MVILRKFGIILTSSALSFGMFSSIANASNTVAEQPEKVQIQLAITETVFTKNDLIKKLHSLFPKKFDFLTNSDFHMGSGHSYPNDDTVRYDLFFSKTINGKRLSGNVVFVGEDLDIEQYSYQPPIEKDALFPAKVSKEEARVIAENFMKKTLGEEEYQIETNPFNYFPKQILTEPVRYSFSFTGAENKVPISEQRIEVSVQGNGEITSFYRNPVKKTLSTFDDIKQIKEEKMILAKVKEDLSVNLQYQLDVDYQTGDRNVRLVYQPTSTLRGVHATSGKWLTANGYSTDFPQQTKLEKITANPLPPKKKGITVAEAKKTAEKFLDPKSDKIKLNIQSVEEVENYNGQAVIRIEYMYNYANGGSGTNLEINKHTGEIIQYHDLKRQILDPIGQKPQKEKSLSQQEALSLALNYIKEFIPSYLHNYVKPVEEPYSEEMSGSYHFSFPRIVNGIMVIGDQINVGIAPDGSLSSLNVNYQEIEKWPSSDKVISEEKAKAILKESLSLKLNYIKQNQKEDHYDLVYLPVFNKDSFSFLDANTGKWNSLYDRNDAPVISHPWAEEELNYLIHAQILDIKDKKNFNGNASVSKGEAIKIMMNSLTYFYEGMYHNEKEKLNQTFDNIGPKHPLYQAIERAVEMGIIEADDQSFDINSPIKREELAVWYIRVLGLEQAAKHSNIYKLDFVDASKIQKEYTGYIAMANALELFKVENNQFSPDQDVTYAELAVSTIRLAHELSGKRNFQSY